MAKLSSGARQLPVAHLSIRVPWHDSGWNGTVCRNPLANTSCLVLVNIGEGRNDAREPACAGKRLDQLPDKDHPPCVAERATFMAPFELTRTIEHVYAKMSPNTHGHFLPTKYRQPPYSAPAIPFDWLRRARVEGENDEPGLAEKLGLGFQPEREQVLDFDKGKGDDGADKPSTWVNERGNQLCLLDTFFSAAAPKQSLCFFYAKRTPLAPDDRRRVIVAVGLVTGIGEAVEYETASKGKPRAVTFERNVLHSVRPDGDEGFVMPYQAVLAAAEKDPSIDPASCVAFVPDTDRLQFSYVTEHVSHDAAIAGLLACAGALQRTKSLIDGAWDHALRWIDQQLNRLWTMRGPCPGLGSALTALGITNGTLLAYDLAAAQSRSGAWNEDPWEHFETALADPSRLSTGLSEHLGKDVQRLYKKLPAERRALLKLLSRFALTEEQALRFYQHTERQDAGIEVTDAQLLENPYLLYELDRSQVDPVVLLTVDRGLFPDQVVREKHPLPPPSALEGPLDPRRVRAFIVDALERAALDGHTLQLREQIIESVRRVEVKPEMPLSTDVLAASEEPLEPFVRSIELPTGQQAFQLDRYVHTRDVIRGEVQKRRKAPRHTGKHDWRALIDKQFGGKKGIDADEERARQEKAAALEELFASRISVLLGPAGTGKTTLLKMLCELPEVRRGGVSLLAPTGKARVRLEQQTEIAGGRTIAQFLLPLGRYDGSTGSYKVTGDTKRAKEAKTVIIDECSMLTEEQLAAVIDALSGVERLVLVGDPRQLPPIGSGRPFVDTVAHLAPSDAETRFPRMAPGYAELTVTRRQTGSALRDDLVLAHWFSGRPVDPGADDIWERLEKGGSASLRLVQWSTPTDLEETFLRTLVEELKLESIEDEDGFGESLGGTRYKGGACYFWAGRNGEPGAAAKAEAWQILSPVRSGQHGVEALNRLLQTRFRARAKKWAQPEKFYERRTCAPMGPEGILYGDKVISVINEARRDVWPKPEERVYVANGDIGIVVGQFKTQSFKGFPWKLQVEFVTHQNLQVGYGKGEFGEERVPPLELAYALTVHKTQGSEFGHTFVILPNPCRLLSRELLYTALTRQKDRVVVFHQGQIRDYLQYADGHRSEIARRVTNLFADPRPVDVEGAFFEERLIHRTLRGEMVRSKSEVIVANRLHELGLEYEYELELVGEDGSRRYPDFTIEDAASGLKVYWEHLGMLPNTSYRRRWEEKLAWYRRNHILPEAEGGGRNGMLVMSEDTPAGGMDSAALDRQMRRIFSL